MHKETEELLMLSTPGCVKETDFHITFICLSRVLGMSQPSSGVIGEHSWLPHVSKARMWMWLSDELLFDFMWI